VKEHGLVFSNYVDFLEEKFKVECVNKVKKQQRLMALTELVAL